jgi:hypothetical protein
VAEIRPHFEAAARLLRTGRSSLDVWAAFALARLAVVQQRHDEVVSYATAATERAERVGAAAVAARAHWLLGMTAFTLNNWSAAMRHYDEALRLCDATAETTLAAAVHLNASVLNRFLGNVGATWRHRLAAGAALPPSRPVQRHTYLTSGAVTASTESLPLTALLFQNEVVNNAASLPAGPRAEAALTRARMLARLGRTADAERDLDLAEQLLAATCLEGNDPTIQRSNDPTIQGKSIDGREGLQQATVLAFHPVCSKRIPSIVGTLGRWIVARPVVPPIIPPQLLALYPPERACATLGVFANREKQWRQRQWLMLQYLAASCGTSS